MSRLPRGHAASAKRSCTRVVEAYRKIRNVLRVLVANLYDFDPKTDAVPPGAMLEIDRWAMARYADVASKHRRGLRRLRLPERLSGGQRVRHRGPERVLRRRHQGPDVHIRRQIGSAPVGTDGDVPDRRRAGAAVGADSAVYDGRVVAKPARRRATVGAPGGVSVRDSTRGATRACSARWAQLSAVRDQVNVALEEKRQDKTIKSNLSARVQLGVAGRTAAPARRRIATSCRRCSVCRRSNVRARHAGEPRVLRRKGRGRQMRALLALRRRRSATRRSSRVCASAASMRWRRTVNR